MAVATAPHVLKMVKYKRHCAANTYFSVVLHFVSAFVLSTALFAACQPGKPKPVARSFDRYL